MSEMIISEDYNKAVALHRRITANAQAAQESLYEMCKALKEMRDGKLYKELGYQNFEDYTKSEIGMSREQARKYITIYETFSDNANTCWQIKKSKLMLLAKLDEPQREEIRQTVNVEDVSVRELKEKISDLKKANERLMTKVGEAEKKSSDLRVSESKAWGKVSILETDSEYQKQKITQLESEVKGLEEQVQELESRPVEVAVQSDTSEIEKLNSIIKQTDLDWGKKYSELEEENIKLRQEDFRKHAAEIEQLRSDYERRLSEAEKPLPAETVPDTKEVFKAYLSNAVDAVKRLMSFVEKYPDEAIFRDKTKELFNSINKTMEV